MGDLIKKELKPRYSLHFNGLSEGEVKDYVHHKIKCAGGSTQIIDFSALSALHSNTQGNPRFIDNLMTDALILGVQTEKRSLMQIQSFWLSVIKISSDKQFI